MDTSAQGRASQRAPGPYRHIAKVMDGEDRRLEFTLNTSRRTVQVRVIDIIDGGASVSPGPFIHVPVSKSGEIAAALQAAERKLREIDEVQ